MRCRVWDQKPLKAEDNKCIMYDTFYRLVEVSFQFSTTKHMWNIIIYKSGIQVSQVITRIMLYKYRQNINKGIFNIFLIYILYFHINYLLGNILIRGILNAD